MDKRRLFFIGLLLTLTSTSFAQKPSFLLIASTSDEALSFQALSQELAKRDIPHHLVALGTANAFLHTNPRNFSLRAGCHVRAPIHKNSWPANQRLPEGDLMRVNACLSPRIIVTGTHARVQAQIATLFHKKNTRIFVFHDDFEPFSPQSIASAILPQAHHIMLAHDAHKESFCRPFPHIPLSVTGNPKHEMWLKEEKIDVKHIRNHVIPVEFHNRITVLYIQDRRSTPDDSFEAFIQYVKQNPKIVGIYAPPPGTSGAREKALIQMYGAHNFLILPPHISLHHVARISDLVLCHRTHIGIQAALAGLNVAYFDTQSDVYQNPLLQAGLIPLLKDITTLDAYITAHHSTPPSHVLKKGLEIHKGATTRMADFLVAQVEKNTTPSSFDRLPWQVPMEMRAPF